MVGAATVTERPERVDLLRNEFPHLADVVSSFTVRPGEDPWTVEELEGVALGLLDDHVRLEAELISAEKELNDLLRNSGDGAGDDQADAGSTAYEREHELTLVNNLRNLIRQTEHAIERIKDGSYHACEVTGGPIGKARLMAFPRATLSVEAKARQERR